MRQQTQATIYRGDALFVALAGLLLYGATLAPTVLWFDGGYLQLIAAQGALKASAGSHPLWVWVAHQFSHVPLGDVAGRINFVSALFGAVTLSLLYLVLYEIGLKRFPRLIATLALAISHTFWSNAVTAEIYTLTLAMMALQVWSALRWQKTGKPGYLTLLGLVIGLGMAAHLLILLYVPALIWLAWRERAKLGIRPAGLFALGLVVGATPLIALLLRDAHDQGLSASQLLHWALLSSDGNDFTGAVFAFSLRLLPRDLFEWLAYLGLQFVGLAGIAGLVGVFTVWRMLDRTRAVYVLLLYLGAMAFAFAYRVGDRYVFYLPSYLPFAIWIGFGVEWLGQRLRDVSQRVVWFPKRPGWGRGLLLVLVLIVPITLYRLAPELVSRGASFRAARHVPGPASKYYFLWPPKTTYRDARTYAEETLASLPQETTLFADHVLIAPLIFLQKIERVRPDVTLVVCCGEELRKVAGDPGERPLAIADTAPDIYPVDWLQSSYELRPAGTARLLVAKER